jgi:DNA-binding NarL/FixJ family response regulator
VPKKIKLLLIEDNRILREGIVAMLVKQGDISVVESSGKKESSLRAIHRSRPDVVLLDLGLRSLNSLLVVELVKRIAPRARVIVMDLAPVQGDIIQFVKAGASGFILKDSSPDEFLATIRRVADGAKILPHFLAESLLSRIVENAVKRGKGRLKDLLRMSGRERDVVRLIGEGFTNADIGKKLHAPPHTIKSHILNIMEKLALHTRLEIANYGNTAGAETTSRSRQRARKR